MSSSITPLGQAVRLALVAGTAGLASTAVLAQDATPTTLDRIEITGSRIRQVDVESAQPVLSISRADIERQGFSSVADILQNLTAVGSPAISRSNVLAAGENAGGTYIDMRNLGAQRTLVLINGKRLGINTGGYQDISSVPVSAIERMEVLKDGASAIYGSDAMAGVINIITRSNVDGVTANVYHGQYSQGDGARNSVDVVAGWSNDRASLTFSAEHTEEKGVWARDRWFSESQNTSRHPGDGWTQISQWGQINGLKGPGCTAAAGCNYSLDRGTDPTNPANYHLSDLTPITGDVSNAQEQMHLISPLKRDSLFLDGQVALTDDIRLTTQLGYNKRTSTRQIAGYPLQSSTAGIGRMSADSWFNPFGNHHGYEKPTDIAWNRRTWEVPRVSTSDLTTWRAVAALEGSFEVGERYFDWEVGYQYNRSELVQRATGNLNKERVKNAVGPSYYNEATGKVECGVPGAPIAGCIPWNPLAPYGSNDPNGLTGNPALIDYLFPPEVSRGKTTTRNAFASIAGTVMTLPAGDLGFAFGVETRKEAGEFIPDPLAQSGATTNLAAGPTGGDYKVNEAYLEVSVPILADLPGARELSPPPATRTTAPSAPPSTASSASSGSRSSSCWCVAPGRRASARRPSPICMVAVRKPSPPVTVIPVTPSTVRRRAVPRCAPAAPRTSPMRTPTASCARAVCRSPAAATRPRCRSPTAPTPTCSRKPRPAAPWAWSGARPSCPISTWHWTGGRSASTTPSSTITPTTCCATAMSWASPRAATTSPAIRSPASWTI